MFLIVGLGNPGYEYYNTRHNIGFDVIDQLAEKWGISVKTVKYKGLVGRGCYDKADVVLLKPGTYMNESGRSVLDAFKDLDVPFSNIIVVHDDVSLDLGRIRIRPKGSSGGHNGIKSIIYQLNSEEFPRVKIGIGQPEGEDMAEYVLGIFSDEEMKIINSVIKLATEAIENIISNGIEDAMNKYNGLFICGL